MAKSVFKVIDYIIQLIFLGKLRDFFRNKNCLSGEVDLTTAKIICQDYVKLDRQTFEQKYQMFYSY